MVVKSPMNGGMVEIADGTGMAMVTSPAGIGSEGPGAGISMRDAGGMAMLDGIILLPGRALLPVPMEDG